MIRAMVCRFVHELVDVLLCQRMGVTAAQLETFDILHQRDAEPGKIPWFPYHRQHIAAQAADRALPDELEIDWEH